MRPNRTPQATARYPIAIAHDYLTQRGGAERVVLALHKAFPEAPIYTTLYDPEGTYPEFKDCTVITSPLNKISIFRRDHRLALPLLPYFSNKLRVDAEKVVVSTTGWAHGFDMPSRALVYCHSPARWIYLTDQYMGHRINKGIARAFKMMRPFLRKWDRKAANRHPHYIANSSTIQQRIFDVYGKRVNIIFPPYSMSDLGEQKPIPGLEGFVKDGYFLIVSRLLPYKNVQHAVEAFAGINQKLLVIGAGPMKKELEAQATDNVAFASNLSDEQMQFAYANSKALLAVSHEDFGITPLEGGAFGKPAIALQAGGFLDTIVEGVTGTFIKTPSSTDIRAAVENFDETEYSAHRIKEHIQQFSEERFIAEIKNQLDTL
ncbi:MAG TPA: glycosyltransferase [Candidatus Rothia avistercoris]|uniref:D-inositol 3-phosphate glycosyltransferase n=1 Tax=Candidatus Rothia avistercoris TaxID=2840479 RepID=A0A9D2ZT26_9MICC|nr:glycosyltransferase [Candidatus Rothia avistercoris]